LDKVRLFGDLIVAAFFQGDKPKVREAKRSEYASVILSGAAEQYRPWLEEWRHTERPLVPFHWEMELPEVFDRENPGFDAVVGNPPFAGSTMLAQAVGPGYTDWLREAHPGSGGKCDLVAFF